MSMLVLGNLGEKIVKDMVQEIEKRYPEKNALYSERTKITCPRCRLCVLHKFIVRGSRSQMKIFVCAHCFATNKEEKFFFKEEEITQKA